ncbi:MAG TPA: DAK2 domain-containing protein, partial [Clostridiales bacterium]|nr:DAK2 domain-containing protein [Clostridiales bacterium]
ENGAITVVEEDAVTAAYKVTRHLIRKHGNATMITIFYGEGATEEDASRLESMLNERFGNIETVTLEGGQPVYHFIISVE